MRTNPSPTSGKQKELSDCHEAPVSVRGGGEGTSYYVCGTCHQACDLYVASPASDIPELPDDSIRGPKSPSPSPSQGLLKASPASGKDELRASAIRLLKGITAKDAREPLAYVGDLMQLIEDTCLEIIGEDEPLREENWDCPCGTNHHLTIDHHEQNKLRSVQRATLARKLGKKEDV